MIYKQFQAKTESEALELAKKELGDSFVYMNTKPVKKKGILGLFASPMVEVTVALEEESEKELEKKQVAAALSRPQPTASAEKVSAAADAVAAAAARTGVNAPGKSGSVDYVASDDTKPSGMDRLRASGQTTSSRDTASEKRIEERLDSLQTLLEQQIQKEDSKEAARNAEAARRGDASAAGAASDGAQSVSASSVATSGDKEDKEDNGNVKFLKLLYRTMLDNEIHETYANQIIDELDSVLKPNMPIDFMLSNVYQKMILKFGQVEGITPATKGPKMVFFVGPTGVGKTTTIAKIASLFTVEKKKKVALFTTDTYRIAAAEQLRTYANILEVPFRVIYTIEEMLEELDKCKDYDYILVDTAGHSHQNVEQREAMFSFIKGVPEHIEKEVYLVSSATTKYKDLVSIADTYSAMTSYKMIFTKLDETTNLGNMLNLKLHTGATMSYVTVGQMVPDDIEEFNPQKTVKILLGGNKTS